MKAAAEYSIPGFLAVILFCIVMMSGCQSDYEQINLPALEEEQAGIPQTSTETASNSAKELQSSNVEAPVTTALAPAFIDVDETVYVIGSSVNFRENWSVDSDVINTLDKGTSVKRVAYSESWSKVVYEGHEGYMVTKYLSRTKPESAKVPQMISEGSGRLIAIDAGHQSKGNSATEPIGPGASKKKAKVASGTQGVSTGLPEYKLNLAVSKKLKTELEKRGYRVYMIRDEDEVDISNAERAKMANKSGADILLRIHANSLSDSSVHGTLTMCQTPDNPYNGDLYGKSSSLSRKVVDGVSAATGFKNRGVQETDTMSGINWCSIPVTIVEMGFMSNAEEDEKMALEEYQKKISTGIADGIDAYYASEN